MQVKKEKLTNINNKTIWLVEFKLAYKFIALAELFFEEIALASSSNHQGSESIEPLPNDIWEFKSYFSSKPKLKQINESFNKLLNLQTIMFASEIEDIDWVSLIQSQSKPFSISKFYIANNDFILDCPKELLPIELNPGRAFGTGEHFTTKGCLEALANLKTNPSSILDVGTGSGILSIAAKKLWPLSAVFASEIDEAALEVAKENFLINSTKINLSVKYDLKLKHDIIVSNILAAPLILMAEDFNFMLKSGGFIILSGFLDNQFNEVSDKFYSLGLKFFSNSESSRWQTLTLIK